MDYENLSFEIIKLIGGEKNVIALTHCVTRLRFTLVDDTIPNKEELEKLKPILGIVNANNQYQIILGGEVIPTYNAIVKKYNFEEESDKEIQKKEKTNKNIFSFLMDYISGTMVQIIPLLIGAGLVSAILSVASLGFGVDTKNSTYQVFNAVASNTLYFMPAFIGFAAARKLKCNPFLAAFIGLVLFNPKLTDLINSEEVTANLFGLGFPRLTYSSTIFPMLIGTWILSKLEPFVYNILPKMVKSIFGPFFCIVIMVPLMLLIIGPLGHYIGYYIAQGVLAIQKYIGFLGCGFLAMAHSFLVMLGAHTVTAPVMTELLGTLGYDNLIRPAMLACCFATFGSILAVAIKSKNKDSKSIAYGAVVTSFVGTTEPGLYGILLPLKTPLIGTVAGSFVGGSIAALLGAKAYAMGKNGIFGLLVFAETTPAMIAGIVSAALVGFIVTWLLGFNEIRN